MKQLSSFAIFTSGYAKVVSMAFPILPLISANGLRTFNSEPSEFPSAMLNNIIGFIHFERPNLQTLRKSQPCARNKI
ncbi:MAG: hypothetical protein ACTS6P_01305 [Candidatus Hodgkinia cicadicola]